MIFLTMSVTSSSPEVSYFEGVINAPIGGYVLDDCLADFALKKKMVDPSGCFVFFVNRGRVVGDGQVGS